MFLFILLDLVLKFQTVSPSIDATFSRSVQLIQQRIFRLTWNMNDGFRRRMAWDRVWRPWHVLGARSWISKVSEVKVAITGSQPGKVVAFFFMEIRSGYASQNPRAIGQRLSWSPKFRYWSTESGPGERQGVCCALSGHSKHGVDISDRRVVAHHFGFWTTVAWSTETAGWPRGERFDVIGVITPSSVIVWVQIPVAQNIAIEEGSSEDTDGRYGD